MSGPTPVRGAPSQAQQPARLVRGLVAGLITGGGAVVAHAVAGGHSSPGTSAAITALAMVAGLSLAHWRIGWCSALLMAGAAQAASHLAMNASTTGAHHVHAEHGEVLAGGSPMLLAHALVVVGTTLLTRGADRVVLDALQAVVARFVPRTWSVILPAARPRPVHRTDSRQLPAPARAETTPVGRRGPPALSRSLLPTT